MIGPSMATVGRGSNGAVVARPPEVNNAELDAANLAGLLRRQPGMCLDCLSAKLVVDKLRAAHAIYELRRTLTLEARPGRCSVCGRGQHVFSLGD